MTKISVIMPVYNVEKYLRECLDNVTNQTLKDIEIICVNDGSTDNSLQILEEYAKKDKRIKIINQENKKQGAARNNGIKHATGEYISFIDSDDFLELNAYEKLYNNIKLNNSEIVLFKIARFNENDIDYSKSGFDLENIFKNIEFDNFTFNYKNIKQYIMNASFAPWTKLYKTNFLKSNNIEFPTNMGYEDVLFHIKVMLKSKKISFLPDFCYYYRFNPNSSINMGYNALDIFKVIDSVESFLIEEKYLEEFRKEFIKFKFTQINQYIIYSKSEQYFELAKKELLKLNKYLNEEENLEDILRHSYTSYQIILSSNSIEEYKLKINTNKIDKILKKYKTSRIELKNYGNDNSIEIIEKSDLNEIINFPEWLKDNNGIGAVIQSDNLSLDLKIKCIKDGTLNITLRGLDVRDKEDNRFPIYIDYTSLIINNEEYLKENKLVWHDEPFVVKRKVENNEIITIHAEWQPFNSSSLYENKTITKLKEEVETLKKENKKLQTETKTLKKENKKLQNKQKEILNSKSWKITKPLRSIRNK